MLHLYTKIAASTVSIMQLYDQGRLDIDGTLQPFVTGIDTTDKKDKTIRDMMAHHGWFSRAGYLFIKVRLI